MAMPTDTGPTETVIRPDRACAHGRWEAPTWAFWSVGAIIVLAAVFYGLVRVGVIDLNRLRKKT